MQFIPYLGFDGDAREAMEFYAQVFGAQLHLMTYGDSPMAAQMPPETHGRVMHAFIDAGGGTLMGADAPPGSNVDRGGCVNAQATDVAEAERLFAALSEGAKQVQMPLQETFWAQRFGMVVDRFGKAWMVNCLKPMPKA
jgi:PhnB protein